MNKKAGKDTVIAILVAAILVMAAGYALLSSHLKITGGAGIGGGDQWNVAITNITEGTPTGSAINRSPATHNGTVATFDTLLQKPGDSMTYDITIANQGDLDAVLDDMVIVTDPSDDNTILYEVTGVQKHSTTLDVNTTNTVTVRVSWNENVTEDVEPMEKSITVILNYVQR